ncbi:MAG: hypothetical protein MZV64_00170 [Ignavibacteriales bacterium]|nr:hypothetical protein [Ignavibacteriales bacterium]
MKRWTRPRPRTAQPVERGFSLKSLAVDELPITNYQFSKHQPARSKSPLASAPRNGATAVITMTYGLILPADAGIQQPERDPPADLRLLRATTQPRGLVSVRGAVSSRAKAGSCTTRGTTASISSMTRRTSM